MKGGGGGGAGTEAKRNDLTRDGGDGGGLATDGEHTITAGECVVTMTYEGETVVNKKNIGLGKDETKEQLILRLREILQNHINEKNSFIE